MNLLYKNESYSIIGCCMEVHNILGRGHKEIIYQDALEIEFQINNIPYQREITLPVNYKEHILPHHSRADFLLFGKIVLEIKAIKELTSSDIGQVLNAINSIDYRLGLLVNFGAVKLEYKRIVH